MKMKRKVMVSFEGLPESIRAELRKAFPDGFQKHLTAITDHKNNTLHVLKYETTESEYLIKMENYQAHIANLLGDWKESKQE